MIPGMLVDFLDRASVGIASSRSRGLVPRVHFLSGWRVEEDREVVECLVTTGFTDGLLEALQDNGRFTMTAEVIGPHETYQFKGTCDGTRPAIEADAGVHQACRRRFLEAVLRHYPGQFKEADILAKIGPPAIAVRLRVAEVYVQTPGPAAGKRLFPRGPR